MRLMDEVLVTLLQATPREANNALLETSIWLCANPILVVPAGERLAAFQEGYSLGLTELASRPCREQSGLELRPQPGRFSSIALVQFILDHVDEGPWPASLTRLGRLVARYHASLPPEFSAQDLDPGGTGDSLKTNGETQVQASTERWLASIQVGISLDLIDSNSRRVRFDDVQLASIVDLLLDIDLSSVFYWIQLRVIDLLIEGATIATGEDWVEVARQALQTQLNTNEHLNRVPDRAHTPGDRRAFEALQGAVEGIPVRYALARLGRILADYVRQAPREKMAVHAWALSGYHGRPPAMSDDELKAYSKLASMRLIDQFGHRTDAPAVCEMAVSRPGALSIVTPANGDRPWWWDLNLKDEPLYRIGGSCDTCEALFQRLNDRKAAIAPRQISAMLNDGLDHVSDALLEAIRPLLPKGLYWIGVLEIKPELVRGRRPKWVGCSADYFWWRSFAQGPDYHDYELVLPSAREADLDPKRVETYRRALRAASMPTALAFSILDSRVFWGKVRETGLAHFLLDGHHKVMAASRERKPIRLLSFFLAETNVFWLRSWYAHSSLRRYYGQGIVPTRLE